MIKWTTFGLPIGCDDFNQQLTFGENNNTTTVHKHE